MKRLIMPTALLLAGLSPVGCVYYEQPPQRVVYSQPPAYQPQPDVSEQYRPLPPPAPVEQTTEVVAGPDVQVVEFHEQLAPYGHWVAVGGYGDCWVPAGIGGGWRPYTVGHWVYTDSGMAWVSDERWGWATYHYGRWALVDGIGWVWVPATHWGPAWVAWRNGDGYCGWAPLPPSPGGVEVVEVRDVDVQSIPPSNFCFCQERDITAPRVYERCVAPERNVTIINRTTNITRITVVNNRVVNRSWNSTRIEQVTGRPVRPVPVHEVRTVDELSVAHGGTPRATAEQPQRREAPPAERHQPDDAAPQPQPAPRAQADAQQMRAAYDAEVQSIEQSYAQQRAEMSQRFAMERRQHAPGPGADDLAAQQQAEMKALEKRHQQELAAARRKYHQQ